MSLLADTLRAKQTELGLADGAFAARLGITRSAWCYVRQGKRRPGPKVIAGMMRAFPRLTDEALVYLRDRVVLKRCARPFTPLRRCERQGCGGVLMLDEWDGAGYVLICTLCSRRVEVTVVGTRKMAAALVDTTRH